VLEVLARFTMHSPHLDQSTGEPLTRLQIIADRDAQEHAKHKASKAYADSKAARTASKEAADRKASRDASRKKKTPLCLESPRIVSFNPF